MWGRQARKRARTDEGQFKLGTDINKLIGTEKKNKNKRMPKSA